MGSRVVGCQTPRSSGSRPGIQGPEGPASRKHHGTTRARTGAWLRAIFATKGTDRAGGSNCEKDPAVPTWIRKPHSGTHRGDLTVPFDPALPAEYHPLNRNKLRVGGGPPPCSDSARLLATKGVCQMPLFEVEPRSIS